MYNKSSCNKCKGTGVACHGKVLGWGISIPSMKCRDCLGTGSITKTGENYVSERTNLFA